MISPAITDLWVCRGTMILSPGNSTPISMARLPPVEPLTRK